MFANPHCAVSGIGQPVPTPLRLETLYFVVSFDEKDVFGFPRTDYENALRAALSTAGETFNTVAFNLPLPLQQRSRAFAALEFLSLFVFFSYLVSREPLLGTRHEIRCI